jgi:hypothetical protein
LVWKGRYDNVTTYTKNDAVRAVLGELGGSFYCTSETDVVDVNPIMTDGDGVPVLDSQGNLKPNEPHWDILSLYGASGADGKSATITVGTVQIGEEAAVENTGTASDAVLNFTVPKGDKGDMGVGINWTKSYNPDTVYKVADACYWQGYSWICVLDDTQGVEPSLANTGNWDVMVKSGEPFVGTDGVTNGHVGLIPAPQTADKGKILTANGGWANPLDNALGDMSVMVNGLMGSLFNRKMYLPFKGTVSEIPRGWQLCDGTHGTVDMREQFIRCATNDSQVGTKKSDSTALPNSTFLISDDAHTHSIDPPNTSTTENSHSHTVNPSSTSTGNAGSHSHAIYDPGHYHKTPADSASGINGGGDGDWVINNGDGYSRAAYTSSKVTGISIYNGGEHSHTVDIPSTTSSTSEHTHDVNISSFTSGSDTHNHTISGGDTETAPKHIYLYFIAYTGADAPNW